MNYPSAIPRCNFIDYNEQDIAQTYVDSLQSSFNDLEQLGDFIKKLLFWGLLGVWYGLCLLAIAGSLPFYYGILAIEKLVKKIYKRLRRTHS